MYAILDIEATNGKPGEERIIDIAIYRMEGHKVTDRFSSLVNPETEIGFYVERLTGITNKMVRKAPKFYELAKRVIEITEGCTLVGHNIDFDLRMLRQEFRALGFAYSPDCIDTLKIAQALIPNQESYSLGKLCKSLGIPISGRHRADGDALATLELFKILLDKDHEKLMQTKHVHIPKKQKLCDNQLKIINNMPHATGVYYFLNRKEEIIYIGKSLNIAQRVNQHFTGYDRKSRKIIAETVNARYEITGSELLALIKESYEIKLHQPKINRSKRRTLFAYGLFEHTNTDGYKGLKIKKLNSNSQPLLSFTSFESAKKTLFKITEEYHLCQKINGLYKSENACFAHQIKECLGACIKGEEIKEYNARFEKWKNKVSYEHDDFLLIDKGRTREERTFFLIENGTFKGYGYFEYDHQIKPGKSLNNRLVSIPETRDVKQLIQSFAHKGKLKQMMLNGKDKES